MIGAEECVIQSVDISQYQELQFSCDARRPGGDSNWTGINVVFYDENFGFIFSPNPVQVTDDSFSTYTTTAAIPAEAHHVDVWLYTTEGATVNGCSLTASATVQSPVAPSAPVGSTVSRVTTTPPFCPAYTSSSIYRARPTGTVMVNADMPEWEQQIENAPPGSEVLLADGVYMLDKPQSPDANTVFMANEDVTVRSLSGNADAVIIRSHGYPFDRQDIGFMIAADGITIADLTIHSMRDHAISLQPDLVNGGVLNDTHIYNVDAYDIGTQHFKGNSGGISRDAVIACSSIGYTPGAAIGDYNGGIDIHSGDGVIIRDNYLYNITGDGTGCNVAVPDEACIYISAPAIYMNASSDTIIERNTIVDSFRGISLGLIDGHTGGIVRNNFVYRSVAGDMGISIDKATDSVVEHNTVLVEGYLGPIEVRGGSGHTLSNNLTNLPIRFHNNPVDIFAEGNIEYATDADFETPGQPHLRAGSVAIGAGIEPATVVYDIDGDTRLGPWDVGADQFTPE